MPSKYKRKKHNKYPNECEAIVFHNKRLRNEIREMQSFLDDIGIERYYMISDTEIELIRQHLSELSCIKKDKYGQDIE